MAHFDVIAFDADDTLWHTERLYEQAQTSLAILLEPYAISRPDLADRLYQTEGRNIHVFGYGIKSFTLSMIETALEITGGRITGGDVREILDLAKSLLDAPVELLEHVQETVTQLAARYRLMLITKGDLYDQESKVARSGLVEIFHDIEVVSDKTSQSYAALFRNHALEPQAVLMVGNSLRSDILPVLELGATAVYIPYQLTWQHEAAHAPAPGTPRFHQLEHIGQLPALLERLESQP